MGHQRIVVAGNGSGEYSTIQEAVNAVPKNQSERVIIYIKNGVYREKLLIEERKITLIGENVAHTIIEYNDYAMKTYPNGELYHTFNSYTIFIGADDFIAEGITFVNAAGSGEQVGQALAAYVDGDRVTFRACRFLGCQDTLFNGPLPEIPMDRPTFGGPREGKPRAHRRQYFESCYIEGDVDFIFGSATAIFKQCEIFSKVRESQPDKVGFITAASTPADIEFGFVFIDCKLTSNAPPQSVYLGRPWRIHAKVAFLSCWLGEHIKAEGWHNWDKPDSESTTVFAEYKNIGPGSDIGNRESWSHQLTDQEAVPYMSRHILSGEDNWMPLSGGGVCQ